jgi:hypothetical protein
MTEGQAKEINNTFKSLRSDNNKKKATADSLRLLVGAFDEERNKYNNYLKNSENAYLLSEEENQMLRDSHKSLKIGKISQDISIVTLMFTIVMLIKVSSGR